MANLSGYLQGLQEPDETPDTQKGAPDLFKELGILSPSEKAQQAQHQQQVLQLLQQQLFQQKQQQAQQTASTLGSSFGFPLFTAMGGLNRPPQQQQMPQQQQGGFDPGSLVAQELAATPDDRAGAMKRAGLKLLQLGGQKGDSTLQRIGSNLIVKAQKESVVQQKAQADQADAARKAAQAGNPGTPYNVHTPNGDIRSERETHGKLGEYTGTEILSQGPNKEQIATLDDPRTQTQKGKEYMDFKDMLTNTRTAVDSMRDITKNLEDGAAQGWAAKGVSLLDNAVGTLNQLAPGSSLDSSAQAALAKNGSTFKSWAQKTGVNESIWNDLVSNLAKTYNPTGTITEKDIVRAARVVGQNYSNPQTVAAILKDAERRAIRGVTNSYEDMGDDARAASQSQFDRFMGSYGSKSGVAKPKTEAEYDALPSGTPYVDPDDGQTYKKK